MRVMRVFFCIATCSAFAWAFIAGCTDGTGTGTSSTTGAATTSTGSGGGGGSIYSNVETVWCKAIRGSVCEAFYACCTRDTMKTPTPWDSFNLANCKNRDDYPGCFGGIAQFKQNEDDGLLTLNQAALDKCVERLKAMAAGGAACAEPTLYMVWRGECAAAYEGLRPPGAACTREAIPYQCKDGQCENGACALYLKTGDACPTAQNTSNDDRSAVPANTLCNYVKGEECLGAGATGSCGPAAEIGEACHLPGMWTRECRSQTCDATGKCVPTQPTETGCY